MKGKDDKDKLILLQTFGNSGSEEGGCGLGFGYRPDSGPVQA